MITRLVVVVVVVEFVDSRDSMYDVIAEIDMTWPLSSVDFDLSDTFFLILSRRS